MPDSVSVEGGSLFFLAEEMEDDLFGENAGIEVGFLGKNGETFTEVFPPPPPPPPRSGFIDDGFYEQPCYFHFLDVCFLCKKPLSQDMDIFMYRDTTFCSKECRQEQFNINEGTEGNRIPSVRVSSFNLSIYKSKFFHFLQRVRSILANDVAQLEATIKAPAQALISLSMLRDSSFNLSIYKSKFFHFLQRVRPILANDVAQLEATIKAPAQALISLSMLRDSSFNLSIYKSKFFHFLKRVRSILANDVAQLEATIKATAQALNLPMLYFRIFEECSNLMHQMMDTWYETRRLSMTITRLNPRNLEACNFLAD
ncbi:hypothetical protein AAC387_Pa06g0156 [Persea americana]